MGLQRNVYEGWTPADFINELEPMLSQIMQGNSYIKPFTNKKELTLWCNDNQPYYKKRVPEVINYFSTKYVIK